MRVLFMGTSPFAVPALQALVDSGYEVVGVVTQPDRPSGRGQTVHKSPVKVLAESLGMEVFQPEKIRTPESVERVRGFEPLDFIVVAAFGQIIPQVILDIPRLGSINVHGSLLPKYRGAAPIQYAVLEGEKVTGVTTMLMDAGLDTGDMLLKAETEIMPDENAGELMMRLSDIGAKLLIETLQGLERGEITPEKQDDALATLAKSIKPEEAEIDWAKPARDIVNLVRAFTPRPGAYTFFAGSRMKVFLAELATSEKAGEPGEIVEIGSDSVIVAAGEGFVRPKEVQPENRKRMTAGEFVRGARVGVGARFDAKN
jgi:methionyl-tRNA formyltransferase